MFEPGDSMKILGANSLNLLCLGEIGNGKSSLISTLFTSLNYTKPIAQPSTSTHSFTKTLTKIEINSTLQLYDIFGLEQLEDNKTNYDDSIFSFEKLLDGRFRNLKDQEVPSLL